MIVTPLDILMQKIKDYFGYPEDYNKPISKKRLFMFVAILTLSLAILLTPLIWLMVYFSAGGIEQVRAVSFSVGIIYGAAGILLMKRTSKHSKIKMRGWLSGKGNLWKDS